MQCVYYGHVSLALKSSKLQVFINIHSLKILSVDIHLPLTFIQTDLTWNDPIVVGGRVTLQANLSKCHHALHHTIKRGILHYKYHSHLCNTQ